MGCSRGVSRWLRVGLILGLPLPLAGVASAEAQSRGGLLLQDASGAGIDAPLLRNSIRSLDPPATVDGSRPPAWGVGSAGRAVG